MYITYLPHSFHENWEIFHCALEIAISQSKIRFQLNASMHLAQHFILQADKSFHSAVWYEIAAFYTNLTTSHHESIEWKSIYNCEILNVAFNLVLLFDWGPRLSWNNFCAWIPVGQRNTWLISNSESDLRACQHEQSQPKWWSGSLGGPLHCNVRKPVLER